jgi:hypothetical protein
VPLVIGLDYRYVESHGLYRQCLWQALTRAHARGAKRVCFGVGAPVEKERLGATAAAGCLWARTDGPSPAESIVQALEALAEAG